MKEENKSKNEKRHTYKHTDKNDSVLLLVYYENTSYVHLASYPVFLTTFFELIHLTLVSSDVQYFSVPSFDLSNTKNVHISLYFRVGAFFFIVMNYVFGNMAAVDIFIKDRALFM